MTDKPRKIELWAVDNLIPYAANAKVHDKTQVNKLAQSIKKFGWTQPIVVWKNGEIIAGHGRRLAAIKLGQKKVPVVVRDDLTKAEADALRLADNRVASVDYDQEAIQKELQRLQDELRDTEIDLSDLGFDEKEIEFSTSDLGEIDDNFFTDDIAGAVAEQQEENENDISDTDESAAPVTDALGFKRIKISQSRALRELMTQVEANNPDDPVEEMIAVMKRGLEN